VSATLPFPDALIDDPQYSRLKEHVVESTGLTYYIDKDADLVRRVGRRLSTTGERDCASYLDLLRDPLRGPCEQEELIAEITIGETSFFRHQEHFDALRDVLLPDLIARNNAKRSLRIWCAGCADGPEPYSLTILMKREMGRQLAGWDVTVLGTDINRRYLARARAGKFEEWAFRSVSSELKQRCFSREGKLWSIAPEYKEWVSFQYHNLVEHPFPLLLNGIFSFDLIVCRNVMIYFGLDLMRRLVGQFHDCLIPGGWLLVGPTEPNMICFTSFRAVNAPGVTLYQRPDHVSPRPQFSILSSGGQGAVVNDAPLPLPPPAPDLAPAAPASKSAAPTLADARRYADRGEWAHAVQCCDQLLEKDNLNPDIHLHQALVFEQMDQHAEAELSLRRAIYLDRQSVLAHYYLGLFLQSRADSRSAARLFENTLELLRSHQAAETFANADGITAGELTKLTKMHLEILRERV
jgi:chemotaxis protein methyltransferase CheR